MNICVVGIGYVGLVTGTCFAEFGITVTCLSRNEKKIENLKKGKIPIYEPGLVELVVKNQKEGRLIFTTDFEKAVKDSLVIFIAVGTPQGEDGGADLSQVVEVATKIASYMDSYKVIVNKSTVPVGTGKMVTEVIRKKLKEDVAFDVVSNPEFLREGSAIEDSMRPNRVVIGANSDQAVAIMKDLYRPLYLIETPIVITSVETSELIKYASNAFLATKISFINEIANLCERVGADVNMVAKGMGLDRRIGPKFLHAGPGYGGSCFPKDTHALQKIAEDKDYEFKIVRAAMEVNDRQREWMVEKVKETLGNLKGKTLAILGLSFKPNTDDIRDAPALYIIERLLKEGASVKAYDPAAMEEAKMVQKGITYCEDAYETMDGSDGVLLITEWNQFRNLDLERVKGLLKNPVFIDMRNVYETEKMKQIGLTHVTVGRYH
jgi:UDPglucose 6-dehydrogenase